jgi:hypothetical protein
MMNPFTPPHMWTAGHTWMHTCEHADRNTHQTLFTIQIVAVFWILLIPVIVWRCDVNEDDQQTSVRQVQRNPNAFREKATETVAETHTESTDPSLTGHKAGCSVTAKTCGATQWMSHLIILPLAWYHVSHAIMFTHDLIVSFVSQIHLIMLIIMRWCWHNLIMTAPHQMKCEGLATFFELQKSDV